MVLDRDLDEDGSLEAVVAIGTEHRVNMLVFSRDPDAEQADVWRVLGRLHRAKECCLEVEEHMALLREGRVEVVAPSQQDVRIGDARYRLVAPD